MGEGWSEENKKQSRSVHPGQRIWRWAERQELMRLRDLSVFERLMGGSVFRTALLKGPRDPSC